MGKVLVVTGAVVLAVVGTASFVALVWLLDLLRHAFWAPGA